VGSFIAVALLVALCWFLVAQGEEDQRRVEEARQEQASDEAKRLAFQAAKDEAARAAEEAEWFKVQEYRARRAASGFPCVK
jgi:Tfp pilus assembly protein PilO